MNRDRHQPKSIGQDVYHRALIKHTAAPGTYKIVAKLPVESDNRLYCRISVIETFQRTADETKLALAD